MQRKFLLVAAIGGLALGSFMHGCGNTTEPAPAPQAPANTEAGTTPTGSYNFSCGSGTSAQQKQTPYQQQSCQQGPGQKQSVHFPQSDISDFDVRLDCDHRIVVIKNRGIDSKEQNLPIRDDGRVKGTLDFHHDLDDDGRGHHSCFVIFVVDFDGKADCSRRESGKETLSLATNVSFQNTDAARLAAAGVTPETLRPSASPSAAPSAPPSPSMSPTLTPTMPMPISPPHPSPTFTFSPTPIRIVTPIPICLIEDPCPWVSTVDLNC